MPTINLGHVTGADGQSAYDAAGGDATWGTLANWLASLKGDTGDTGPQGDPGTDATVNATNMAAVISGAAEKTTPVDADKIPILDSAASGALKWLSWANLWAGIKSKLDGALTISGAKTWTGQQEASGQQATTGNSLMTRELVATSSRDPSIIVVRDDFWGGNNSDGTIGDLGWYVYSAGGGTGAGISMPQGSPPNIGLRILTTGNAAGAGFSMYLNRIGNILATSGWMLTTVCKIDQTTSSDLIVGFTRDNLAIGVGKYGGPSFGVRYSSAVDTKYTFFSKETNIDWAANDSVNYSAASAVDANTGYHTFRVRSLTAGVVEMSVDGGAWVTVTIVTAAGNFIPFFHVTTRTAASKSMTVDFFSFYQTGVAR